MRKLFIIFLSLLISFLIFSSCDEQNLQDSYSDIISAFAECEGQVVQTNINMICEPKEDNIIEMIEITDNILNNFLVENRSTNTNNSDNLFLYTVSAKLKDDGIIKINTQSKDDSDTWIETKISSDKINEKVILKTINLSNDIKHICSLVNTQVEITSIYEGRISKEKAKHELFKSINNKKLLKVLSNKILLKSKFSDYENRTYVTYTLDII